MYGIDSGNGYVYGEDESATADADDRAEEAGKHSMDSPAPSGASSNNL